VSRGARVLVALGLLAGAAAIAGMLALRASLPQRSGRWRMPGLEAPVEIRFDHRARPHVHARTLGDAFFAQGVLHARERLWQMEILSRAGRGRLAEMLGPPLLDTDRELWRSGVPQLAARIEAHASDRTRALVARYVAGVNAAIAALPARPPELLLAQVSLREWRPADVYALGAAMAFASGRNMSNELLRFAIGQRVGADAWAAFFPHEAAIPAFPYVMAQRIPQERVLAALARRDALDPIEQALMPSLSFGSNGWAVAPSRSRSGEALFAFDSHDALAIPNLHYEVHLFFEGGSLRGWSVPGLPGVINGWNDHKAWGFTNIGDSQDLFLETRDAEDPQRFLGPHGPYRARVEVVEIPVRFGDADRLEILHTRHGPLIHDDPPLSLAWAAHRVEDIGLDGLFDLNRATDWASTSDALDRLPAPSAAATYADVEGHVAFRVVGALPRRGRGEGLVPLPGHEAGVEWQGLVPMHELPRLVDPPAGFVAAANARVNPPGTQPLVSADNAPGYRIARIQSVLAERRDHTPEHMRALQTDWRNGQAERLGERLLRDLDGQELPATARRARDLLRRWLARPVNAPDAAAPLIFQRFYLALAEELFAERLGPELWPRLLRNNYLVNQAVDGLVLAPDASAPWWRGERRAKIRRAFLSAVDALAAELGDAPDAWRWDARHVVHFVHELATAVPPLGRWLNRGPYPWGGGHPTVGRARSRYDVPERVRAGATMRVVLEMTAPPRAWAILPGGQAGHLLDAHYDDQIAPWLAGELDALDGRAMAGVSTVHLDP